MIATFNVVIDAWPNGETIPEEFAFGVPSNTDHMAFGQNKNPTIRWSGAPKGTRSFAIVCHDPDVPSIADDVNREGAVVSADLTRTDFFHWVLIDIDARRTEIPAGADSDGVTLKGKPLGKTDFGVRGLNNYTDFLAGDPDMEGDYAGYDGPCPPWNDEIIHHYHFTVYALDVESVGLDGRFGGPEVIKAIEGHVLAKGTWVGTYTLNPALRS